jgi:hypothetical protein
MIDIHTERSRLIALSTEQLQAYLASPGDLEEQLGLRLSRRIITDHVKKAINKKILKMTATETEAFPWFTYWLIVIIDQDFGAGLIGFKGSPDESGEVEIGYGIDPVCQNKGYVTEAARGIISWAFRSPGCGSVIAPNTSKSNVASNRVLEKIGMKVYYENGEEFFWRIEKDGFLNQVSGS